MTILKGHTTPETAYVIDDYPYGFTLRCKIRYWLDANPKRGARLMSQTTNPKKAGAPWNKPKASTYARFGACMFLDDNGHVQWSGLNEYSDGKEASSWREQYGAGVPEVLAPIMNQWVEAKLAYDKARENGGSIEDAVKASRVAAISTYKRDHATE